MRIIACRVHNLPTNIGVSRTFRSLLIGKHLSDASRDLETLTFVHGGHGAGRRCASSCSIRVPRLKFVGLPVRKILRTSGLSISRSSDLDLFDLEGHGACRDAGHRAASVYTVLSS